MTTTVNNTYWDDDERSMKKLALPTRTSSYCEENLGDICKSIVLELQKVPCYDDDEETEDEDYFIEDCEEYWGDFDKPNYCTRLSRSSSFSSIQSDDSGADIEYCSDYDSDTSESSRYSGSKAIDVKYYYT
jgi:hypothetical protein